jgi:hypothetical protein
LQEKLVMPIKTYKPEQIVTMLRQIEVSIEERGLVGGIDRRGSGDVKG